MRIAGLVLLAHLLSPGCAATTSPEESLDQAEDRLLRTIPAPQDHEPVTLAAAVAPSQVAAGGRATVLVAMRVARGWHVDPTMLMLRLNGAPAGEWDKPPAPRGGYRVCALFRTTLSTSPPAGERSATVDVTYVACDPLLCRPPVTVTLPVTYRVLPREK